MTIHTSFQSSFNIFRKCICTHRNNRNILDIFSLRFTNEFCCFIAIHYRHLNIHKHKIKCMFLTIFQYIYAFFSITSSLCMNTILFQNFKKRAILCPLTSQNHLDQISQLLFHLLSYQQYAYHLYQS